MEVKDALKDTRAAVSRFLGSLNRLWADIPRNFERTITQEQVWELVAHRTAFEECFEREHHNLRVFMVTPKGLYDTRIVMEHPENDFPERLRSVIPPQSLCDLIQAGRCLAFDIPTACAFHVCRGTEALMLAYYGILTKHSWPEHINRDWHQYITHLGIEGAPPEITNRLMEIKNVDRNHLAHPDKNVTLDEAYVLFKLGSGVNYYMAEEMVKTDEQRISERAERERVSKIRSERKKDSGGVQGGIGSAGENLERGTKSSKGKAG